MLNFIPHSSGSVFQSDCTGGIEKTLLCSVMIVLRERLIHGACIWTKRAKIGISSDERDSGSCNIIHPAFQRETRESNIT